MLNLLIPVGVVVSTRRPDGEDDERAADGWSRAEIKSCIALSSRGRVNLWSAFNVFLQSVSILSGSPTDLDATVRS